MKKSSTINYRRHEQEHVEKIKINLIIENKYSSIISFYFSLFTKIFADFQELLLKRLELLLKRRYLKNLKKSANKFKEDKKFNIIMKTK